MSKIEVNAIEPQCGTTLTLGANNDKIVLGTGASFGGGVAAILWETTAQAGDFGALSGRGYFVNTTSAPRTVTLPATPSAGDIVAIADYAGTSISNNITIARNGSNINGEASDLTIAANNSAVTLVYVDGTEGWKTTSTSNTNDLTTDAAFVVATGGTITCCGDYKIHTFTGPGTFTVTCAGNSLGSNTADYYVIAGGGGGGSRSGAGGGAGGYRESVPSPAAWTTSPLGNPGGALPVSVTAYPITVGGGGAGGTYPSAPNCGVSGSNSIFSTITSAGGGGGGTGAGAGGSGGSGGGARSSSTEGAGNTPPVSPPQGNPGGFTASGCSATGGGGAGAAGATTPSPTTGGVGGNGVTSCFSGSPVTKAGGGGGGGTPGGAGGAGGSGGGGAGTNSCATGTSGTANTGGGAGGGGFAPPNCNGLGGAGGSGIVIIRYKYQ